MENYYELLNVPYTANNEQIKKSYVSILKMYHPDVYKGDCAFAQKYTASLNIAYSVLTSGEERLKYDKSIFPKMYSWNYYYDDKGNRVPIITQLDRTYTESEFDSLPAFSLFNRSKFSESIEFNRSLTPLQRLERKTRKKEEKLELKKQKLLKKLKKENINISKKEDFEKSRRKLNISIIILTLVIAGIFGLIIYLNIVG